MYSKLQTIFIGCIEKSYTANDMHMYIYICIIIIFLSRIEHKLFEVAAMYMNKIYVWGGFTYKPPFWR